MTTRYSIFTFSVFMLSLQPEAFAATLSIRGNLEKEWPFGQADGYRHVYDWHVFVNPQDTQLTLNASLRAVGEPTRLILAQLVGAEVIGSDALLFLNRGGEEVYHTATASIAAGRWIVGYLSASEPLPFDLGMATGNELRIVSSGGYRISLTTNEDSHRLYWAEHREGNLNGLFTVTSVPEPSTAALIGGGMALLWHRNGSARKQNKALLPTPRGFRVFIAWCRSRVQLDWRVFSRP